MNSEKVWLICLANLHFIKLYFCTMSSKRKARTFVLAFLFRTHGGRKVAAKLRFARVTTFSVLLAKRRRLADEKTRGLAP